jgi:hypothetical protein
VQGKNISLKGLAADTGHVSAGKRIMRLSGILVSLPFEGCVAASTIERRSCRPSQLMSRASLQKQVSRLFVTRHIEAGQVVQATSGPGRLSNFIFGTGEVGLLRRRPSYGKRPELDATVAVGVPANRGSVLA